MTNSIKNAIETNGVGCHVCGELAFKTDDYQCIVCRRFFCGEHLYMSGKCKACKVAANEVNK